MASFIAAQKELESYGPQVVIVGNGAPFFLKAFRDHVGRGVPIYTDPELQVYNQLALARSVRKAADPRTLMRGFKAYRAGHRQGATKGDALQLGGVFLVDTEGEIRFAYRSRFAGDHPEMQAVIAAVSGSFNPKSAS